MTTLNNRNDTDHDSFIHSFRVEVQCHGSDAGLPRVNVAYCSSPKAVGITSYKQKTGHR